MTIFLRQVGGKKTLAKAMRTQGQAIQEISQQNLGVQNMLLHKMSLKQEHRYLADLLRWLNDEQEYCTFQHWNG